METICPFSKKAAADPPSGDLFKGSLELKHSINIDRCTDSDEMGFLIIVGLQFVLL